MRNLLTSLLLVLALAACGAQPAAHAPADAKLDALFAELQAAPDAATAEPIEKRIWEHWAESGSATVDVLLERAAAAEQVGNNELANRFLDRASDLAPNYAEPWNRRANLAYKTEDYAGALAAIRETLKREPRHFGALAAMGLIYEELGKDKAALEAFHAALAVHPYYEPAVRGAARLEPRVNGRAA
jgi:tetratricopeptide (TPR) repeat protein